MANRAWLYLRANPHDDAPPLEIASANNQLPVLWQVLLAHGGQAAAGETQDVFGGEAVAGVASDARDAHERLCELAAFMLAHAGCDDAPHCLQFDGAARYLAALIDEHDDDEGLWISANLNELSWLYEGGRDAYAAHVRTVCDERWHALQQCMGEGDAAGVRRLLGVEDEDDASAWAWRFGFGGLSHPYFAEQEPVREVSFEDFNEAEAEDDEWLGGGMVGFRVDKLWGVRVDHEDGERVLVPAEWEAIWRSGASDERVLWISRNGRTGLLRVDDDAARVLMAPQFESVWDFEDDVAGVLLDGKIGLIAADGRVLMQPCLDEIWSVSEGLLMARVDGLLGYVDLAGQWAITPRFENAGAFSPGGLAPAFDAQAWGLIDRRGAWVVPPAWEDIDWSDELHAYVVERDGQSGLIDASGRLVLDACYAELAPLDTETEPAELWAGGLMRIVVLTDGGLRGVVDGDGAWVVPAVYGDLGAVSWLPSEKPGIARPAPTGQAGRYVRVLGALESQAASVDEQAHDAADEHGHAWAEGVYDIHAGAEILPCLYALTFGLEWDGGYGWLVLTAPDAPCPHNDDGLYLGVARAGGDWLHAPVYAWIGSPESLRTAAGIYNGPPAIAAQWSQGLPVRAQRGDTGAMVMLDRDGRETPA